MQSSDNGTTWTLFSDQMLHGYRSTVSCYPFRNYIVVADIDRDNGILYYNKFDGTTFTQLNTWTVPFGGDDFHNVNIASNYSDTVILEFMHAAPFNNYAYRGYMTDYTCDNVMLVGSTKTLPTFNFDSYIDTQADFRDYANLHWGTGVNNNSYTWNYTSGSSVMIKNAPTTFVDEIEIPLNFMQLAWLTAKADFYLLNSDNVVWPWSNNVNQQSQATSNISSCMGFVTINSNRYAYLSRRPNELPVLCRVNYLATFTFTPTSSQNDITGQSWQESLGFRRVLLINKANNSTNITPVDNSIFNDTTFAHKFAFISYTPVPSEVST